MKDITDEEAALYDRQIRLWGLESQKRLHAARILICGMTGTTTEIIKNLVLAGIGSITLLDHRVASERDLSCQFFLRKGEKLRVEEMLPFVQDLNPRVSISIDTSNLEYLIAANEELDEETNSFLKKFDIICLSDYSFKTTVAINNVCRKFGILFYLADECGMYGWAFNDLGNDFEYTIESKNVTTINTTGANGKDSAKAQMQKGSDNWISFADAMDSWGKRMNERNLTVRQIKRSISPLYFILIALYNYELENKVSWKSSKCSEVIHYCQNFLENNLKLNSDIVSDTLLEKIISCAFSELAPVAAIVGGVVSQDMIRSISRKEKPVKSFFLFDGVSCSGALYSPAN